MKVGEKVQKKQELDIIMEKIPDKNKAEATLIYNELKFILKTIKKLKTQIRKEGAVEKFEQGKQNFLRESPALTGYNKMMKTYDTFYKNLINLLPKDGEGSSGLDGFEDDDL